MPKMKRASAKVAHFGIKINRGLYGYFPTFENIGYGISQQSKCFNKVNDAVDAVLNGYLPTIEKEVRPDAKEASAQPPTAAL